MSDDDDQRGSKDNTSPEPKPEDAKNLVKAPGGQLGTDRIKFSSPGLGGGTRRAQVTRSIEQTSSAPENRQERENQPVAVKTCVKNIDEDSLEKGYRLETEEEIKRSAAEGREPSEKKGEPKRSGPSARDIFAKFAKDRDKDKDKGRG